MILRLVRRVSFSAGVKFPDSTQAPLYGAAAGARGLGCNYGVEAHVEGPVDPLTGMIVNLRDLDLWLREVVGAMDHHVLNELPAFKGRVPTAELIAAHVFSEVSLRVRGAAKLVKVRVTVGEGLAADVFG